LYLKNQILQNNQLSLVLKKNIKKSNQKNKATKITISSYPLFGNEIKTAKIEKRPVRLQSMTADILLDKPALTNRWDR
jgi:hypothetical protein